MVDKLKKGIDVAHGSRITTLTGMVLGVSGMFVSPEAQKSCFDAIAGSDHPELAATLLISGGLLTVFGPSLKRYEARWLRQQP